MTTLFLPALDNEEFFSIELEPDHEEPSFQSIHDDLQLLLQEIDSLNNDVMQLRERCSATKTNLPPIIPTSLPSNDAISSNINAAPIVPLLPSIDDVLKEKCGENSPAVQARQRKRLKKQRVKTLKRQRFNNNNPNLSKQPRYIKCPWKELDCRDDIKRSV